MAGNDVNTVLLLPMQGAQGETVLVDRSVGGSDKAIGNTGLVTTATKRFGDSSLYCFGGGQHASLAVNNDFSFANLPFTVDGWFKADSGPQSYLWAWYLDGDNYCALEIINIVGDSVKLGLTLRFGGVTRATIDNAALANLVGSWHHVALVRNGTALTLYVDGAVNGTATVAGSLGFNFHLWPLLIGKGIHRPTQQLRWLAGYVDEFRVHKSAYWTSAFTPPAYAYFERVTLDCLGRGSVLGPQALDCIGASHVDSAPQVLDCLGASAVTQPVVADYLGRSTVIGAMLDCLGSSNVEGPLVLDCIGAAVVEAPLGWTALGRPVCCLIPTPWTWWGLVTLTAGRYWTVWARPT